MILWYDIKCFKIYFGIQTSYIFHKKYVAVTYIWHPLCLNIKIQRPAGLICICHKQTQGLRKWVQALEFQKSANTNVVMYKTLFFPLFNFFQNLSNLFRVVPPRSDATLLGRMKMHVKILPYCGLPDEYI